MATEKATTTDDLSGANLKTDADAATAELSVDSRKSSKATLKGGTKIEGPADVVAKLKNR